MEDQSALSVQLKVELDRARHSLDSLGAAKRLTQKGKIEDLERQLRAIAAPDGAGPLVGKGS